MGKKKSRPSRPGKARGGAGQDKKQEKRIEKLLAKFGTKISEEEEKTYERGMHPNGVDIHLFAKGVGLDIDYDTKYLPLVLEGLTIKLPPGWTRYVDPDDRCFYVRREGGMVKTRTWRHPRIPQYSNKVRELLLEEAGGARGGGGGDSSQTALEDALDDALMFYKEKLGNPEMEDIHPSPATPGFWSVRPEDVVSKAAFLGVTLEEEPQLAWIIRQAVAADSYLPPSWSARRVVDAKSGKSVAVFECFHASFGHVLAKTRTPPATEYFKLVLELQREEIAYAEDGGEEGDALAALTSGVPLFEGASVDPLVLLFRSPEGRVFEHHLLTGESRFTDQHNAGADKHMHTAAQRLKRERRVAETAVKEHSMELVAGNPIVDRMIAALPLPEEADAGLPDPLEHVCSFLRKPIPKGWMRMSSPDAIFFYNRNERNPTLRATWQHPHTEAAVEAYAAAKKKLIRQRRRAQKKRAEELERKRQAKLKKLLTKADNRQRGRRGRAAERRNADAHERGGAAARARGRRGGRRGGRRRKRTKKVKKLVRRRRRRRNRGKHGEGLGLMVGAGGSAEDEFEYFDGDGAPPPGEGWEAVDEVMEVEVELASDEESVASDDGAGRDAAAAEGEQEEDYGGGRFYRSKRPAALTREGSGLSALSQPRFQRKRGAAASPLRRAVSRGAFPSPKPWAAPAPSSPWDSYHVKGDGVAEDGAADHVREGRLAAFETDMLAAVDTSPATGAPLSPAPFRPSTSIRKAAASRAGRSGPPSMAAIADAAEERRSPPPSPPLHGSQFVKYSWALNGQARGGSRRYDELREDDVYEEDERPRWDAEEQGRASRALPRPPPQPEDAAVMPVGALGALRLTGSPSAPVLPVLSSGEQPRLAVLPFFMPAQHLKHSRSQAGRAELPDAAELRALLRDALLDEADAVAVRPEGIAGGRRLSALAAEAGESLVDHFCLPSLPVLR